MTALKRSIAEIEENPQQNQALCAQGHCVVLAPPGSGKTKLLATRLARDLIENIPMPYGAVCITLTNPAANELKSRLDKLGLEARSTLYVGTVHGFALTRVIRTFAVAAGQPEIGRLAVASDAQRTSAMTRAIREIFGSEDKGLVRSTIERNRKLMATDRQWRLTGPRLRETADRYEYLLRSDGLMDFDDIVAYAVSLVEGHEFVRHVLTSRYPVIYVDEYQDLAPGLDRLVKALCFDYYNSSDLFAVGDPDQAIYGWTGSRPELLDELGARSDVTRIYLDINYRSKAEIIKHSIRILDNFRRIRARNEDEGGLVEAHYVPGGYDAQVRAAAQLAVSRHNQAQR